jgi:hypothetical protein
VKAAVVDWARVGKVVAFSLIAGIGVSTVFAIAVTSWAGMIQALRRRRSVAGALWAGVTVACVLVSAGAIALGIVVMARKS